MPRPTAEQIAVIQAPLAPALVVAGAGSGKTETMAARVVYLVATGQVRPEQVLGLTFTRKAAGELGLRIRRRLRALAALPAMPGIAQGDQGTIDGGEPTVVTYHAFGGQLISEFGPLLGVEPAAAVLTPTASWQLARRVVGRWDGDLDTDLGPDQVTERLLALSGGLSDHLTATSDLAVTLQDLLDTMRTAPPGARQRKALHSKLEQPVKSLQDRLWILPLVEAFAAAKRSADVVDFADQMNLAARLVSDYPTLGGQMRDRFRVVLLDEYQDTGHAQRILLRGLFGVDVASGHEPGTTAGRAASRGHRGHPVTAVGDPVQSIYSWRGASAGNLVRFVDDFPLAPGRPAPVLSLLTSFRNPTSVLDLANAVSAPLRSGRIPVATLRPREGAEQGTVRLGLFSTVVEEDAWVADRIVDRWRQVGWSPVAGESSVAHDEPDARLPPDGPGGVGPVGRVPAATVEPPTTAVLLRRRRDMPAMAEALRARGLPVEVVGLGGLLSEPEVADLVATLHVLVDPTAGPSAVRLLTGARWQIGMSDLDALARRARALAVGTPSDGPASGSVEGIDVVRDAVDRALPGEDIDAVSLVDAAADPGDPGGYTATGLARITRFAGELDRLRQRLGQPLVDLVADVERTTGLDVEAAVHGPAGRAHLDAIADVVAEVAATGAGPAELLDYFAAAQEREDGLRPGEASVTAGSVQILTVHAAKGLEWDTVAVPHLSVGVFPSTRAETWLGDASQLPPSLRGDRAELPELALPKGVDQGELAATLAAHVESVKEFQLREERRLLYVALTRSEHTLLASGHHWGATGLKPLGPSEFLTELAEAISEPIAHEQWAAAPAPDDRNPLTERVPTARWPQDPLGTRRSAVEHGADLVRRALDRIPRAGSGSAGREGTDTGEVDGHGDARGVADGGGGPTTRSPGWVGAVDGRRPEGPTGGGTGSPRPEIDDGSMDPGEPPPEDDDDVDVLFDPVDDGERPSPARTADSSDEKPDTVGGPRSGARGGSSSDAGPGSPIPDEHRPDEHRPDEHRPDEHRPDEHRPDEHRPDEHRPDEQGVRGDGGLSDVPDAHDGGGDDEEPDPFGWAADVDLLLAERQDALHPAPVRVWLPGSVSVSTLVELAEDPGRLARRLRRPLPVAPTVGRTRGSAFHQWVEYFYTGEALLDMTDLVGAPGAEAPADPQLEALQAAFLTSGFSARSPVDIEVPFSTTIAGIGVKGRIDAVFADPDGGYTVVDWKTGRRPSADRLASSAVQLASYRLAVAQLWSVPLREVRAAFHFVASNETVAPVDLLDGEGLAALIAASVATPDGPGTDGGQPASR
nr:UvrD-helicase domain-containing protein [Nakamurella flavida]